MDSDLRRLERAALLGGDDPRLERARLRAGAGLSTPGLRDFIRAEANALALELVGSVAARQHETHVFLEGPTGTGKTLLLRALHAARPDSFLWSGLELHERALRAIEEGALLDAPRLLVVDDLTRASRELLLLLARSLHGRTLVAAGSAAKDACAHLGGRLVVVGHLEEKGRRELFARAQRRLGAPPCDPDELPRSGFEIEGLARNLALRATT